MADEPTDEILEATHRALCAHGYADLTLQDIAAETDRSKSSIHYYYDTKGELLAAFLDSLYEQYTAQIDAADGERPREHLHSLLDVVFLGDDETTGREFQTALLAVKAQAPYNQEIKERLEAFDQFLFERLRTIVADGVETGEFSDDIDPAVTTEFLMATIKGGNTRRVTIDRSPASLHASVRHYVETCLQTDSMVEA